MTEQIEDDFWAPEPPRTELERLSRQVVELQDLLTQAERDTTRALQERDDMRDRVSEPYGCAHCGAPKRFHARRYLIGIGMHEWAPPTDEQVKTRMLARRAARKPLETEPPAHGKLWSLLDWSFWGAGMGDVFRMPLADAMLAAVPPETIAQAEQIMAEFIERRNIEKTGVTVYQEQRDELEQLRARVAELEEQREHRRVRLVAVEADLLEMRGLLSPNGFPRRIPPEVEIHERVAPAVEWLLARVAELETELAEQQRATKYFASQSARRRIQRNAARTELARVKRPSYSQRHVWSVWREAQPFHGFYGTEDDARQGSIDCWEENEARCPDYSWKPDGPRLELLVGGETSGVYISRDDVFGRLAEPEKELAEARAELAKYVSQEPTVADEMAYLSRCLDTVRDLCDLAKQRDRATVTVAELEMSINCEWQSPTPRPALPWAHAMPDDDLHGFLDDLVSAAMGRWRSEPEVPDRQVLADVEKACADWRTPGQGYRSDEPGAGESR